MTLNQPKTFELRIYFAVNSPMINKSDIINALHVMGVHEFVEGVIDDVDIDHDYKDPQRDFYSELGGNTAPISLFKYNRQELADIKASLAKTFPNLHMELLVIDSSIWQHGWKQSFKPIITPKFLIYPPWDRAICGEAKYRARHNIVLEPGMAFGTGQHATTKLCLELLEEYYGKGGELGSVADIGCGSGILSIAAARLGFEHVYGVDIEADAIVASTQNFKLNKMDFHFLQKGSADTLYQKFPQQRFQLVIANILKVVLVDIFSDLITLATQNKLKGGSSFLILSGILVEDEHQMLTLAHAHGFVKRLAKQDSGWVALLLERYT